MAHAPRSVVAACLVLAAFTMLAGCQSAYYGAWEKLGWHKRDILVDRMKTAADDQQAAKKQIQTTLEKFRQVAGITTADELEPKYNALKAELDRSQSRADAVHSQIKSVQEVADALFSEWQGELKEYKSDELRRASARELDQTRQRYDEVITAMQRAADRMQPVLDTFHDQVLFLKHNLNARAVASLDITQTRLESDVQQLIDDMNTAIAQAQQFVKDLQ